MFAVICVAFALLVLVGFACWFLVFPDAFDEISRRYKVVRRRRRKNVQSAPQSEWRHVMNVPGIGMNAANGAIRRHWVIMTIALALLLIPPAIIFATRQTVLLEDFHGDDFSQSSTMVAHLLRGERLVPPPAPPPEVFTTSEIRRMRPEIVKADRKWDQIDPELQQRVLAIYEVMRRQHGYEMVLIEGYRSPERQAELMAGGKATRAGAWQSCHQYGLGVDSAPIRSGKLQWDMNDPWTRRGYYLYGELAVEAGLDWGGNWRSLKDYVHVEMTAQCRSARAAKREELARQSRS